MVKRTRLCLTGFFLVLLSLLLFYPALTPVRAGTPTADVYVVTDGSYDINDAMAVTQAATQAIVNDVGGIAIKVHSLGANWGSDNVDGYWRIDANNHLHYYLVSQDAIADLISEFPIASADKHVRIIGFTDYLDHNGRTNGVGGRYAVVGKYSDTINWPDVNVVKHELGHTFGLDEGGTWWWEHGGKICVMNYWHAWVNTDACYCTACEAIVKAKFANFPQPPPPPSPPPEPPPPPRFP